MLIYTGFNAHYVRPEGERPLGTEIDGKPKILPIEKYGIKLLSIGFFVDPEQALIWRGPMASGH